MVREKLNLTALQSNMKVDPGGYTLELSLLYNQFKSSLDLFHHQASLNFTSLTGIPADSSVAIDLGDQTLFLAHVTPFYPQELTQFPTELLQFLKSSAPNLLSGLRLKVTKALILLKNRNVTSCFLIWVLIHFYCFFVLTFFNLSEVEEFTVLCYVWCFGRFCFLRLEFTIFMCRIWCLRLEFNGVYCIMCVFIYVYI